MSILDKITEELKKRGFTQKELAEYIQIPSNSMTEWKAARHIRKDHFYYDIKDVLIIESEVKA